MKLSSIIKGVALATVAVFALGACSSDADTASRNLSKAAEQFEIERRVTFINGITDEYLLVIEGRCSVEDAGAYLETTCKVGPSDYTKHYLGLSDNVTYLSEQIGPANVDAYHHRVIWKPEQVIPNVDIETSGENQ